MLVEPTMHRLVVRTLSKRLAKLTPGNHPPPSNPLAILCLLLLDVEAFPLVHAATQVRLDSVGSDNHVRFCPRSRGKVESDAVGVRRVGRAAVLEVGERGREKLDEFVEEVGTGGGERERDSVPPGM
jgi:hypothetical protein